jgi:hypothetical protein
LDNNLLGGLSSHATEVLGVLFLLNHVGLFFGADDSLLVEFFGFFKGNLQEFVFDFISGSDDGAAGKYMDGARLTIESYANFLILVAIIFTVGGGQGSFDGLEDNFAREVFLVGDLIDSGNKVWLHIKLSFVLNCSNKKVGEPTS